MAIKRNIKLNFLTDYGKSYQVSFEVYDGESAYEVWLKQPGNAGKTEQQFFADIKGERGDGLASVTLTQTTV